MSLDPVAPIGAVPRSDVDAAMHDALVSGAPAAEPASQPGGLAPGRGVPGEVLVGEVLPGTAGPAGLLATAPSGVETALAGPWAQAHAETAPWGNPADDLAAGGQHRLLSDMARELAHAASPGPGAEAAALREAAPTAGWPPLRSGSDVLPAAALAPALAAGLQTAEGPATRPTPDEPLRAARRRNDDERRRPPDEAMALWDDEPQETMPARRRDAELPGAPLVAPEADDEAWCTALWCALQRAAALPAAQPALQAAAESWRRDRAVLLACPQGPQDASVGWCFVLRRRAGAADGGLAGRRFAARLTWACPADGAASPPAGHGAWHVARLAKSFAARRGPQLAAMEDAPRGGPPDPAWRVACELQLGPFPAPFPRWREVLVRVDAARRLWSSLGGQWSLPLIVCSGPLLAGGGAAAGSEVRA